LFRLKNYWKFQSAKNKLVTSSAALISSARWPYADLSNLRLSEVESSDFASASMYLLAWMFHVCATFELAYSAGWDLFYLSLTISV